jgi:Zn-dependent oligopeptidase
VKRTEDDKVLYDVTHKTPDIFPLVCTRRWFVGDIFLMKSSQFKYAQNAETRRRAHESYEARLELNSPLLDRALELRRNIAGLLGYKTWADYVTEVKMVKSGDNVAKARSTCCNVAILLTNIYSF